MENINDIIEIKDLLWWYPENPQLLFKNFNFALEKGDFMVIMGKSATGKSTLAKLITGEITPPLGTVFHKKEDIAKYSDDQLQMYRRKTWIIYQDYKLVEELSGKENILYPLRVYEIGESIIETKYARIKQKLNIENIENKPVKFLSSGEKQKVAIARALIHDPEYIIADEPTGNLDREHTQQIADLLIQTNIAGNTVVLITHDIHLFNYLKSKHPIKILMMA